MTTVPLGRSYTVSSDTQTTTMKTTTITWHPYPQEKPTENERYLLTCEYKCCIGVTYGKWWDDEFVDIDEEGKVIAWAELPKAYEG